MKRRPLYPLPAAELEKMPLRQLLARLRRLHQCEESLAQSDRTRADPTRIEFKVSEEWQSAYDLLKRELAKREHFSPGQRSPTKQKGPRLERRSPFRNVV